MTTANLSYGSLELALEPRMMFDAAAAATAAEVAADAQADANPPVSADPSAGDITVDKNGNPGAQVDLFGNVQVEPLADGKTYDSLTLQVSESGKGLALIVDGKEVLLTQGNKVQIGDPDADRYATVTVGADGTATVVIKIGSTQNADQLKTLIDGLALKVADGTAQTSADVTVKIDALSYMNNGGTADLDIDRTVKIESSYNFAPEVDVGGTELSGLTNVPGIENATKIFLSENGNFAFVGDKDGDIAVFKFTDGKLSYLQTFAHSAVVRIPFSQVIFRLSLVPGNLVKLLCPALSVFRKYAYTLCDLKFQFCHDKNLHWCNRSIAPLSIKRSISTAFYMPIQ